jgi:extradiol dioxygenase family protein
MAVQRPRFHLAIPVHDINSARAFYGSVLGFPEGRSAEHWVDYDMFGHELVVHEVSGGGGVAGTNPVDGDAVPVPHFGALLELSDWNALADRLTATNMNFVVEPGEVAVRVGAASDDIRLEGSYRISGPLREFSPREIVPTAVEIS